MGLTEADKRYAADYAKQHAFYEKKAAPIFYRAIAESVLPVIKTLNPALLRTDVWQSAYQKVYKLVGQSAAVREYKYQKRSDQKDEFLDFLNQIFAQRMSAYGLQVAFDFETELNNTTIEQIRNALADAATRQLGNRQTADLIRKYTLGTIGRNRSMLIARTEVTTVTNKAKLEGANEYFKEIGEPNGYKVWVTRLDGKERHDHEMVNENGVHVNEPFIVGGYEGNIPGDPKLPGKERIRCRCTFISMSQAGYRRRFGAQE